MITWMATAVLFGFPLGVAAMAIERVLRAVGRPGRWLWLAALGGAVLWPAGGWISRAAGGDPSPIVLPAVRSTIGAIAGALPPVPDRWGPNADAAAAGLWLIASAVLFARLVLAWRALAAVERTATEDVIAGIPVLLTPAVGPAVFGVLRSRLLVPRWLFDLDPPLLGLVLRHEEEHQRAGDTRLTTAAALAAASMPWNPAVWWIARRLRLAVELDCDARVLRGGPDPERYGRLLLLIAQRQSHTRLAPMLAESNSHLTRRIAAMSPRRPTNLAARAAGLALIAAAALACSAKYGADLAASPAASQAGATYYRPRGATMVKPLGTAVEPTYPDSLRTAKVEGEVLVSFVVDTSGLADPRSVRILRSTHELFSEAVTRTIGTMRFVPAQLSGRKVKQLVQQPFFFDLKGSAASRARKPLPEPRPTTDSTATSPMTLRPMVVVVP